MCCKAKMCSLIILCTVGIIMIHPVIHAVEQIPFMLNSDAILGSLRIQPPLIRPCYYVRNAKTDVCDSPPEIPY